jgi:hypothetical protein
MVLRAAARYTLCDCGSTAYSSSYLRIIAGTYRYNEIQLTDHLTCYLAGPAWLRSSATSAQLRYTSVRIATVTRPNHNKGRARLSLGWVSLGMYFTSVGIAALFTKDHKPRTVFDERWRLTKRMLKAGDICISFCEEQGNLSDAEIWLYHENVHLASVVEGDEGYIHWCRLGNLISACITKVLDMGVESEHVLLWLFKLRKRKFAHTYIFDKAILNFTGRPLRLLRKYCPM